MLGTWPSPPTPLNSTLYFRFQLSNQHSLLDLDTSRRSSLYSANLMVMLHTGLANTVRVLDLTIVISGVNSHAGVLFVMDYRTCIRC